MEIPVRNAKIKRRKEQKTVFLLEHEGKIAIRKRPKNGLLANMYEFPNVDGDFSEKEMGNVLQSWRLEAEKIEKIGAHHHIFSHIEWEMIGIKIVTKNKNDAFIWVEKQEILEKYAIPGAFKKFCEKID